MKGKWKRGEKFSFYHYYIPGDEIDVVRLTAHPELQIACDPRTGKPWKSMKAAREWFDEVTKCNTKTE